LSGSVSINSKHTSNSKTLNKEEFLINAAAQGKLNEVKQALKGGVFVDVRDKQKEGGTPLIWAAYNGHKEVIRVLLSNDADIEALSRNGEMTALLMAAYNGHNDIVEYLLSKGASADKTNVRGDSALSLASFRGHLKVVQSLLGRRANVELRTRTNSFTALHFAAYKGHLTIVKRLVAAHADVDVVESVGKSGTHLSPPFLLFSLF
jgi:ankyrin repeat protein